MSVTISTLEFSLAHTFLEEEMPERRSREDAREYVERVLRYCLDQRPHTRSMRYERHVGDEMEAGVKAASDIAMTRHTDDPHHAAMMACVYSDVALALAKTHIDHASSFEGMWRTWASMVFMVAIEPDNLNMVDHLARNGKWPAENLAELWLNDA